MPHKIISAKTNPLLTQSYSILTHILPSLSLALRSLYGTSAKPSEHVVVFGLLFDG